MHLYPFIIATAVSVLGPAQSTERFEDAACHVARVSIRGGPQSENVVALVVRTLEIPD